jgi:hypothetical protein
MTGTAGGDGGRGRRLDAPVLALDGFEAGSRRRMRRVRRTVQVRSGGRRRRYATAASIVDTRHLG